MSSLSRATPKSNLKVSIVIPVYNGSDYVAEAIDSALAQTYANTEIVVVNDGSKDEGATERICRSYGERIRYFSKPNGGVASALNFGIGEITGDYVSWLSHDDLYLPNKVEAEVEAIQRLGDNAIVYSDFFVFSPGSAEETPVRLDGVPPGQFRLWLTVQNSLHGCTLLIPVRAFAECGMFNESLRTTQDYDLWFRMATRYDFVHIPQLLVKARAHGNQGSITMSDVAVRECNELLTRFTAGLTPAELAGGTGAAPAVAYAQIASSMWRRNFRDAGKAATRLAWRAVLTAAPRDKVTAISILIQGHQLEKMMGLARRVARKVLPAQVRRALRERIAPAASPVAALPGTVTVAAVNAMPLEQKFTNVYEHNIFGGADSRSGAGSDLIQTAVIRREIPRVIRQYGISSMLDAPCGDWHWMQHVDLGGVRYVGVDIVAPLVRRNEERFGREGVSFAQRDLSRDALPEVDMIFSRDCFVHLSYADTLKILQNFKRTGARYLLTTTFSDRRSNDDLGDGFWRPLNLQQAPFNFPKPLELINEACTEGDNLYTDKSLGLWRLADIQID